MVFDPAALDNAFSSVILAMKGTQKSHLRDPIRFRQIIVERQRDRTLIIDSILSRFSEQGTTEFTRRLTRIPKKPGGPPERPISLFKFEDRVVIRSLLDTIWPILEPQIVPSVSYCTFKKGGIHPSRGISEAAKALGALRKRDHPHIFESDIKSFFDRIDRETLLGITAELLGDSSVNELVRALLYAETLLDSRFTDWGELSEKSSLGIPQGAALSPLLACVYLSSFDLEMKAAGYQMIRYVDDLVIVGSKDECLEAEEKARTLLAGQLGLDLHPDPVKTKHICPTDTLVFLGHEIDPEGRLRPSDKRKRRVAEQVYKTICGHRGDFTYVHGLPRADQSVVVAQLTGNLMNYFRSMSHCEWSARDYEEVAQYVVGALRSRGLAPNRLSKQLRKATRHWPTAFVEALP